MTTYGITDQGFVVKPLTVCKSELEDKFKAAFGNEIDLSPEGPFGQIVGILSERESSIWDLAEAVYNSQYPDSATGTSLANVCAITGTIPLEPTKSQTTIIAAGANGTVLNVGRIIQVQNNGARFVTKAAATLASLAAWATSQTWTAGNRRSANGNSYECLVGGAGATVGTGPSGTGTSITDGSATWAYIGTGTAIAEIEVEGETTGPKVANARTLNSIVTAVANWNTALNLSDATLGTDLENDTELRLRREDELRVAGNASLDAIRADVLAVAGVTSCLVFENVTMATDGLGLPPKSIEVVTLNTLTTPVEDNIRAAIWNSKAAGIETYGTQSGTVVDSQGTSHTVKFTRATEKYVWLTVNVTTNPLTFPVDGAQQIKDALVAWALGEYGLGDDVVTSKLDFSIWDNVSGIEDVTTITSVLTNPGDPAPGGGAYTAANKAISDREIARFDTSRITVNVT